MRTQQNQRKLHKRSFKYTQSLLSFLIFGWSAFCGSDLLANVDCGQSVSTLPKAKQDECEEIEREDGRARRRSIIPQSIPTGHFDILCARRNIQTLLCRDDLLIQLIGWLSKSLLGSRGTCDCVCVGFLCVITYRSIRGKKYRKRKSRIFLFLFFFSFSFTWSSFTY